MKIESKEIAEIQDAGELDGSPVKLLRLVGGFWLMTGRPQGRPTDQALSAGSHPAIVKYNVEKQFPNFRPAMMKSIMFSEESLVLEHANALAEPLRQSGYELYSVQTGTKVEFQVTHQNLKVASVTGEMKDGALEITGLMKSDHVPALAAAVAEKCLILNVGFRLK